MPFVRERLTRLLPAMAAAGTRHASVWFYSTTDADVTGAGYFNAAAPDMQKGDVIIAAANVGSATPIARVLIVRDVTATTVTVANLSTT